jgi:large subunit ribosomal protein L24
MKKTVNKKPKYSIRKDDVVVVVVGEDKGKEGRVLQVYANGRVLVDGVNLVSKATRPSAASPNGGIIQKEAPVAMSNVMIKDPKSGKPTRVGRKEVGGKMVRYAKKSGEVIDR